MKYAHVENGEVIKWLNKSPVASEDLDELKARNVLPVVHEQYNTKEWETSTGTNIEITDSQVTIKQTIVEKSLDDYKQEKIVLLKRYGTAKIEAVAPPYKQRNIGMELKGYEKNGSKAQALKDAVQAIVDEIDSIESTILAASTHEEVKVININPWQEIIV